MPVVDRYRIVLSDHDNANPIEIARALDQAEAQRLAQRISAFLGLPISETTGPPEGLVPAS